MMDVMSPPAPASFTDPIQALLDGAYVDSETGGTVTIATRSIVVADTLAGREAELVSGLSFGRKLAVVSDPATQSVLGARVEAALRGRFDVQSIVLSGSPYPDDDTVTAIRSASARVDGFIAVGSGTINDLTKYASALEGKPYAVFAPAPSMNG